MVETDEIEPGDILLHRAGFEIRVMAIAEKWVMLRRKGCNPFLMQLRACEDLPLAKRGVRPKGWKIVEGA